VTLRYLPPLVSQLDNIYRTCKVSLNVFINMQTSMPRSLKIGMLGPVTNTLTMTKSSFCTLIALTSCFLVGKIRKIVDVRSKSSYLVSLPDGSVRHEHINKLRPLHGQRSVVEVTDIEGSSTASVSAVILDQDLEFGRACTVPVEQSDRRPSEQIDPSSVSHLTPLDRDSRIGHISRMFFGETGSVHFGRA